MIYNYHTHTFRCHHASGICEEYILNSIKNGIKYLGFSDHAAYKFPDGFESGYRVFTDDAEDYVNDLKALREKYKDDIEISIGFEMEYYPAHFNDMLDYAKKIGIEYLILGEHFIYDEHPSGVYSGDVTDNAEYLREYVYEVVEGIKSGVFTYVAHPDLFNYIGDDEIYAEEMRKICVASREHNVPLEINFLGIRGNRHYPNKLLWKIAAEEKSPVTFGMDAHEAVHTFDSESLEKAKQMVDKYGLRYIGKPELKLLQKIKGE